MKLFEILRQLERLKDDIWRYCENEETELQKKVKETTNLLLDNIDDMYVESGEQ